MRFLILVNGTVMSEIKIFSISNKIETAKILIPEESTRLFFRFAEDQNQEDRAIAKNCLKVPGKFEPKINSYSLKKTLSKLLKAAYISGLPQQSVSKETIDIKIEAYLKWIKDYKLSPYFDSRTNDSDTGSFKRNCRILTKSLAEELFNSLLKVHCEIPKGEVDRFITLIEQKQEAQGKKQTCEEYYYNNFKRELNKFTNYEKDIDIAIDKYYENEDYVSRLVEVVYWRLCIKTLNSLPAVQQNNRFVLLINSVESAKPGFADKVVKDLISKKAALIENIQKNIDASKEKPKITMEDFSKNLDNLFASAKEKLWDKDNMEKRARLVKEIFIDLGFEDKGILI